MRIGKILIVVGIAVVVLVVGAVVVLMSMDFNQYKPEIAAEVKKATGRDMAIEGDLRLNLLTFNPGLAVGGVRFANAPWGSRPDMAQIKRFEVKVAILPLLQKTLDVERVVIEGADILVERNADGRGNYEFLAEQKPAAPAKAPEPGKPEAGGGLPALAVREVAIKDSRLTYKDAKSNQTLVLALASLTVAAAPGEPVKLDLKGAYNDEPFTVKGTMGELAEALKPSKPWPVKIAAEAGGATVDVSGSIANPAAATGIDLALAVEGKDLSRMSKLAGAPVPPLGPYSLKTKVVGSADKVVELRDLTARMGKSVLAGKAAVQLTGRPTLSATLASDLIDLADFTKGGESSAGGRPAGSAPAPSGGTTGAASPGGGKRLFPDDPLPADALKAADANIDLTVKKLIADKVAAENVHAVVALRNGDLAVLPLDADVAKGKIAGAVQLKASQATPALDIKISGKKIDVGHLLTEMGITDLLYGVVNTELDVAGRGKSVRQIMAGLNGKTNLVMGDGRMKSNALDLYVGGAATVLTQAVFGKKDEYTVINCFVNQFDIKDGVATSKAMLFDTEYAQITGAGTVNLGTEQIRYTVDPKPKGVTVNTAVPVQIGGTLAEPTYRLDPLATAAKVGGLIGTVLFPPAAVVGLGELGVSDKNPCMKQGAGAQPQQPAPGGPAGAIESLGKDVKEKLDKGLKGIFGR